MTLVETCAVDFYGCFGVDVPQDLAESQVALRMLFEPLGGKNVSAEVGVDATTSIPLGDVTRSRQG